MRQPALWFLFSLGLICFVLVVPVRAQSPTGTENSELTVLRNQYRVQLDVYRTDERNFSIARDQFTQLQTLNALEDAVKATQKVLLSRDEVLITYMKMLRLTFNQTTGVQLSLKNNQLKEIDAAITALSKNKELAERTVNREQVAQVVADFALLNSTLQQVSSNSLLIISYGKVQTLFDKTVAARNEIKTQVLSSQPNALKLSEKQRAFQQIDQTVDSVSEELKSVLASLNGTTNVYTQPTEQLNQAYAGISRTLSYLDEVIKP